jgi:nitroreductase
MVDVIRTRRSVSQPRMDPNLEPDHEIARAAFESARWAPNHKRTEPWRFYLLDDARIRRLAELNAELLARRGSKQDKVDNKLREWRVQRGVAIITCTSAPDADEVTRAEDRLAVACAAQNFMLHLWSEGVASKWSTASVWEHEDFWPLLGKASGSEQEDVIGLFFYGHAAEAPPAKRNKELKDVLVDFRAAR